MRWWGWIAVLAAGAALSLGAWIFWQSRGLIPAFAYGGEDLSIHLNDSTHFIQNDQRWGDLLLARSQRAGTIAGYGCTLSSVATAMTNLGYSTTPPELNEALVAQNGFTPEGWLVWSAINKVTGGKLDVEVQGAPSREGVDACLKRGDYPIVKFLIGGVVQHWVMIVGKEKGSYLMRDPLIDEPNPIPLTRRTQIILSVRCVGKTRD